MVCVHHALSPKTTERCSGHQAAQDVWAPQEEGACAGVVPDIRVKVRRAPREQSQERDATGPRHQGKEANPKHPSLMPEGMPQSLVRAGWVGRESTNDESSKLTMYLVLSLVSHKEQNLLQWLGT